MRFWTGWHLADMLALEGSTSDCEAEFLDPKRCASDSVVSIAMAEAIAVRSEISAQDSRLRLGV